MKEEMNETVCSCCMQGLACSTDETYAYCMEHDKITEIHDVGCKDFEPDYDVCTEEEAMLIVYKIEKRINELCDIEMIEKDFQVKR
jgi:hypothetical protein